MPIPAAFQGCFRVPVIAAPMFLVSGPELVIAACKAGVAGTFPSLNARPVAQLEAWLDRITRELAEAAAQHPEQPVAPFGVNLILHHSNTRLAEDLALIERFKVPFVITSLGNPREAAERIHAYGGLVFADVIHAYHAKKAIEAGVEGSSRCARALAATRVLRARSHSPVRFANFGTARSFSPGRFPMGTACAPLKCWVPISPTWGRASLQLRNRWPALGTRRW